MPVAPDRGGQGYQALGGAGEGSGRRETMGEDFYMLWLQETGVADALFKADVERGLNGRWILDREGWRNGPADQCPHGVHLGGAFGRDPSRV